MSPMNARRALLTATLLAAVAALGCAVVPPPERGAGQQKVVLCHKGKKTLEVAAPAADAHLKHGDTHGPCR